MNVCSSFDSSPPNICQDISVWTTAVDPRALQHAWLKRLIKSLINKYLSSNTVNLTSVQFHKHAVFLCIHWQINNHKNQ